MVSLDKCNGSCNVLPPKICVPKETKDINIKAFDMIRNKNEAKTVANYISCNCKCKFNSIICNSNRKWNNKTCKWECKNYHKCNKNYSWNPSTYNCENSKCLRSTFDTSVITGIELIGHSILRYKIDC